MGSSWSPNLVTLWKVQKSHSGVRLPQMCTAPGSNCGTHHGFIPWDGSCSCRLDHAGSINFQHNQYPYLDPVVPHLRMCSPSARPNSTECLSRRRLTRQCGKLHLHLRHRRCRMDWMDSGWTGLLNYEKMISIKRSWKWQTGATERCETVSWSQLVSSRKLDESNAHSHPTNSFLKMW